MKKNILFTIIALLISQLAFAQHFFSDFKYSGRIGFNIGGTSPISMPATIRGLDSYKVQPNINLGIDAIKPFNEDWCLIVGLRLENKDMKIFGRVKNYHMELIQGTDSFEGMYTGKVMTHVREKMFTLPLTLAYNINKDLRLKFGPYMSVLIEREFSGYAHNGYLRVGDPTGSRVEIGKDPEHRGTYDFSNHMRHTQFGLLAGADWYFSKHWGIFGDISWGLTGIHKNNFKTIEQTLYPIYGTFGFLYRFGKN